MSTAEPFTIHIEEEVLDDLKTRLNRTKLFPKPFNTKGKQYGQEQNIHDQLIEYWRTRYDWRKFENELNSFKNFKMRIQGLSIHFIHEQSPNPNAIPLILLHGWPGSVWEFHRTIPLLKNPADRAQAFHLVVPSLPGYGWSEGMNEPGLNVDKVASICNELMNKLGYKYYIAQGGDWGSIIARQIAYHFPNNCIALHLNMPIPGKLGPIQAISNVFDVVASKYLLSERDQDRLSRLLEYVKTGAGYLILHSSKPHTLAYAFLDSPSGLLSWICEKVYLWSDIRDGLLSNDEILTNVMIYWVTQSIGSSMRFYYETIPIGKSFADRVPFNEPGYIETPTGFALFAREALAYPIKWLKPHYNIVHCSDFPQGGHFGVRQCSCLENGKRFVEQ